MAQQLYREDSPNHTHVHDHAQHQGCYQNNNRDNNRNSTPAPAPATTPTPEPRLPVPCLRLPCSVQIDYEEFLPLISSPLAQAGMKGVAQQTNQAMAALTSRVGSLEDQLALQKLQGGMMVAEKSTLETIDLSTVPEEEMEAVASFSDH